MKLKKKTISYVDIDAEIVGVTLLSAEEYVAARGCIPPTDGYWWLRSLGSLADSVACVNKIGNVDVGGFYADNPYVAVRPALRLKTENLSVGDEFTFRGIEWVHINNDLAIAKKLFCMMPFRKDRQAPDANIYETSDVKKYLDKWLKEVKGHEAD